MSDYEEAAMYAAQAEAEAQYEMWKQEWEYVYAKGKEYFDRNIKPVTSNAIDEETWINGFIQGWFNKNYESNQK